jgi:hypothetical protein
LAIDHLLELEAVVDQARKEAIQGCLQALGSCKDEHRKALNRLLAHLRSGAFPDSTEKTADVALAALHHAGESTKKQRQVIEEVLGRDERRISGALRELGRDATFREAMTWQNRRMMHQSIESLLRQPEDGPKNARVRQNEQLVASYLQRYCAKNDTHGLSMKTTSCGFSLAIRSSTSATSISSIGASTRWPASWLKIRS